MTKKTYQAPQAFEEGSPLPIELHAVESNQVKAIGYDPATKTLAVTFKFGAGALYQYPDVAEETFAEFMAAESKSTFFGQHIKPLPFKKYRPEQVTEVEGVTNGQ
jgi:hypothetical protein